MAGIFLSSIGVVRRTTAKRFARANLRHGGACYIGGKRSAGKSALAVRIALALHPNLVEDVALGGADALSARSDLRIWDDGQYYLHCDIPEAKLNAWEAENSDGLTSLRCINGLEGLGSEWISAIRDEARGAPCTVAAVFEIRGVAHFLSRGSLKWLGLLAGCECSGDRDLRDERIDGLGRGLSVASVGMEEGERGAAETEGVRHKEGAIPFALPNEALHVLMGNAWNYIRAAMVMLFASFKCVRIN